MKKLFGRILMVCLLIGFFVSCASIPKCMDDYTYVDGECILRPADQPPDLNSNSQAAVDKWYAKHGKKKEQPKPSKAAKYVGKKVYIAWWDNDTVGAAEAKESKTPMYVYITDDENCEPCRKAENRMLNDKRVINYLNKKFISVKIDVDNPDSKKYKSRAYPSNHFLNYDGSWIGMYMGYMQNPEDFIKVLDKVLSLAKE